MATQESVLPYLDDAQRLRAIDTILEGCKHVYSKGKLQDGSVYKIRDKNGTVTEVRSEDRISPILDNLVSLAENDPLFLAHFTSYAVKKLDSKDLIMLTVFANSLSDADGTPFSPGSKYKKPNLRLVSQAAIQSEVFDPKLLKRMVEIAKRKQKLGSKAQAASHFTHAMKTAVAKYIKFREQNPKSLEGIRKAGLSKRFQYLYRAVRVRPSKSAASLLGWRQGSLSNPNNPLQKDVKKKEVFDFTGLSDLEIAEKIRREKIPVTSIVLPDRKLSPVIAAAMLEQASPNQAVIMRATFDKEGLLKDKETKKYFEQKIKGASALDRVERINTSIDKEVEEMLKRAKAENRKEEVGDLGSVFIHIDISSSMSQALKEAVDVGSTFAEAIKNPEKNFGWGTFNSNGTLLKNPDSFEKDAFKARLYGVHVGGNTNCLACYEHAMKKGFKTHVFITDGGHNGPNLTSMIETVGHHYGKPSSVVIVRVGSYDQRLREAFQSCGIPVAELTPDKLKESALVSQVIRASIKGKSVILEEIMGTKLLTLPEWWETV